LTIKKGRHVNREKKKKIIVRPPGKKPSGGGGSLPMQVHTKKKQRGQGGTKEDGSRGEKKGKKEAGY